MKSFEKLIKVVICVNIIIHSFFDVLASVLHIAGLGLVGLLPCIAARYVCVPTDRDDSKMATLVCTGEESQTTVYSCAVLFGLCRINSPVQQQLQFFRVFYYTTQGVEVARARPVTVAFNENREGAKREPCGRP